MSSEARVPPHDLGAECAVLSAILSEEGAIDRVSELLLPEHFYSEANRRIYEAARELALSSKPVDVATVASRLNDGGRLNQIGGTAYLAGLVDATPFVAHLETYAQTVYDKWRVRKMITTCRQIAADAFGDVGNVNDFMMQAEQAIYAVSDSNAVRDEITLADCASQAYNQIAKGATEGHRLPGYRTGLTRLDQMLGGLRKGKFTVIAGTPGAGKSVLVQEMSVGVATHSKHPKIGVQVFSAEMESEELGERALSSLGNVDSMKFRGDMDNRDWQALVDAIRFLEDLPIFVSDSSEVSVSRIVARLRRRMAKFNQYMPDGTCIRRIGVVIVDYLQLMTAEVKQHGDNQAKLVGDLAAGLKRVAREFAVHVVAISSLNKGPESRQDKRPLMGDLRESGAIAFHADNILLLHRESYYNPHCEERDVVECNIAKQRGGPTGMFKLRFDMKKSHFEDYSRADEWPGASDASDTPEASEGEYR